MSALEIKPYGQSHSRGDLNAKIDADTLLLPSAVADAVAGHGIRTAEDLLSYMQSFPSDVGNLLQWQSADVAKATRLLEEQLRGHVSATQLRQHDRPNPPLGALPPKMPPKIKA